MNDPTTPAHATNATPAADDGLGPPVTLRDKLLGVAIGGTLAFAMIGVVFWWLG